MVGKKEGTTNLAGEIAKGEISMAPEDELAAGEPPKAVETIPEIVTHSELIENNRKYWDQ